MHKIQTDLLEGYRYDIAHYASSDMKVKAENCYFSLSKQLLEKDNHKFQYGYVEKNGTSRKYETSVDWLISADIAAKSIAVTNIKPYPEDYEEDNHFRLYTTDIGMLVGMRDFSFKRSIIENSLRDSSKGGFWEAAIADVLIKKNYSLHFYKNDSSKREIEFVIIKDGNVIPIEVKSNNDYTTVSLERFKEKFPGYCAERYVLHPGNADFTGDIKYLPLYMAPLLANRRGRV